MTDYLEQFRQIIIQYLPYTQANIAQQINPESFSVSSGLVTLTFDSDTYSYLSGLISDPSYPRTSYTISNIHIKNQVEIFQGYPEDAYSYYGVTIKFKYTTKFSAGDTFYLKGFDSTTNATEFKVLKVISSRTIVAYPTSSYTIETKTEDLGYFPIEYTEGFNGIKTLTDIGSNSITFQASDDLYSQFTDSEIDFDYLPVVNDFDDYVKKMDYATFLSNIAQANNTDYLVIDTGSLAGTPNRSTSNSSDANYYSSNRSAYYKKIYEFNIVYLMVRNIDDSQNQTSSGSDIALKQVQMHDALVSISRMPLPIELGKTMSTMTIEEDSSSASIIEGTRAITYKVRFVCDFNSDILLKIDTKNVYPINTIKLGSDVINLA